MKCVHKAIRHFKARNWAELTFAKTSGMVTRERDKKRPIGEPRVSSNDPRNNCGAHFGTSFLLVSISCELKSTQQYLCVSLFIVLFSRGENKIHTFDGSNKTDLSTDVGVCFFRITFVAVTLYEVLFRET